MTTAQSSPPGTERADYLREVCALLWPAPAGTSLSSPGLSARGPQDSELIVLPGLRRPRLVVPPGRRASAAAVRGYGEPGSAKTWLATRALAVTLEAGLGRWLLRDRLVVHAPGGAETIESYLSSVLGQPIRPSMHLGAARANRKPVLQLLTSAGEVVGYAKIGVSPLTASLVRAEQTALTRLAAARLTSFEVPRVLDYGHWQGLEVLVLSPLAVRRRRVPLKAGRLAVAMAELTAISGVQVGPLTDSQYWDRLAIRLDKVADSAERAALEAALGQLASRSGEVELGFGAWHGDWTPWNMASTAGGLLVWDWERFGDGVPVGFDALHYWLQARVAPGRAEPAQAAAQCVEQAPVLLAPLGVEAPQARVTALAYLADLSVRYLTDQQEQAGARLGAPGRWLLPALAAAAGQI